MLPYTAHGKGRDQPALRWRELIRITSAGHDVPVAAVSQGVCHRDLKLENTLLDGRPAPRLKICDFGYSKVSCSPHLSRCNAAIKPCVA